MANTVLIIGNGFDLAHGLPTKYSDFMIFCNKIKMFYGYSYIIGNSNLNEYKTKQIDNWETDESIKNKFLNAFKNREKKNDNIVSSDDDIQKTYGFIKNNIWYDYFVYIFENKLSRGENWIDFECEIRDAVSYIDMNCSNMSQKLFDIMKKSNPNSDSNSFFKYYKERLINKSNYISKSVKELRKVLYNDLTNLILALEKYLLIVSSIKVKKYSPDIEKISPNFVINFNYTETYQAIYQIYENVFHIHGFCSPSVLFGENKMVLGIDEYWPENERDSHTNFTIFKKFAQRIQKRTGIESYKWIKRIKKEYKECNTVTKVYIFGHSLDVTDKDILFDYLNSNATDVTIFCKDKETEGEYIANVIKIIGEKRLLKKINQFPPKLRFVIQQDMIPIKKDEKELAASGSTTL